MTPQQINEAIAKSLGWTDVKDGFGIETRYKGTPSETRVTVPIHRYTSDLNACADMERGIDGEDYLRELEDIINRDHPLRRGLGVTMFLLTTATALQRCEAYLRVKGLWKE
jgi:hypothetical protein